MADEELIARAITNLNNILKNEKILRVSVESDNEWSDGEKSFDISVKYLQSEDTESGNGKEEIALATEF